MQLVSSARLAERLARTPVRATREELRPLARFERLAFRWCDLVNRRHALKHVSQWFLWRIGATWVWLCTRRLVRMDGEAVLREIDPARPLLLCSNHRSFFDMYVLACWVARVRGGMPELYFPVRANFFYERPLGLAVNMVMAGFAMYPPIFRQPEKRDFNVYALARTVELARRPGVMIGFHPEGTRGKGPDPYELLPAQPGVGQVVYEARPQVLPIFVHGLTNDLPRQIEGYFCGRGAPVRIVFGRSLDLDRFYTLPARLRTYKAIADHVLDEIRALGERERALRSGAPASLPAAT